MELRRRHVLAGAAVALAGCTTAEEFAEGVAEEVVGPDGHPLEGETRVALVDRSDSAHDLEALASEALRFWEANAPEYVGFEVDYRRVDAADADVEIVFVDSREELAGCEEYHTDDILGCAPLLREGNRLNRPATVEVVATGRPYGEVRITTKHELGHTLGLGHDDEPAYIMSNDIEDRLPEFGSRMAVLDAFEAAWESRNDGTREYNEGIALWNDREYGRAVEPFERAAAAYRQIYDHVSTAATAATAFEEMARPDTVDREALETYFERMDEGADRSVEAAEEMAAAAEAADDGDRREARERQEAASDAIAELQALEFPSPSDAALALGLVRDEADEERTVGG